MPGARSPLPPVPGDLPSDGDLIRLIEGSGIRAIFTVPCTITAGWHHQLLARQSKGPLQLLPTTHEGNLAGLAAGTWFATGRPALIHLQNCGLTNLADGILTFAHPAIFRIPLAVIVTFRGATDAEASEPHRWVGSLTDALVETIFGSHCWTGGDRLGERPVLQELDQVLRHALHGGLGVLKLSPLAFAPTPCSLLPPKPSPPGDPIVLWRAMRRRQRQGWSPAEREAKRTREEAIGAIRASHPGAAVLFCNGYMARAAQACGDRASDFFNVG